MQPPSPLPVPPSPDTAQLPPPPSRPPAAAQPTPTESGQPAAASPHQADDGDLIEKEWIQKVKQLVASLSDNPRELSRQFTLLKADYMQKRYGKDIKVED